MSSAMTGPLPRGYELLWERMHELSPGDPGGSRFTALLTRRLIGRIDVPALTGALWDVARRHEMLRMRFRTIDLDPVVEIVDEVSVTLHVEELSRYPEDRRHAELNHLLYAESVRAFDLGESPLWRAVLTRLSDSESVLCLSFPDLLFDAWSDRILVQDLMACYRHRLGEAGPPAVITEGYQELVQLHERQYGGTRPAVQEQARRLAPPPDMLTVPSRRLNASDLLLDPATVEFRVPPEVSARLDECARRLHTTPYVVLMAAYYLLIARDTGTSRVVMSTVTLGRQSRAERSIVGQFGQDVFVPVDISWDDSVEALIAQVHRELVSARLARTSYRNLVRLIGADVHPRPWSDLHLYDSYFQSVVPAASMPTEGPLTVVDSPKVSPAPRPGVHGYPTVGDIKPEAMPAWRKQAAPWILINDGRQDGSLNYNRSFHAESTMVERVAAYLEVLRSIAVNPGGTARGMS